ncbi:MAG: aldo/keto reductase [Methanoregulaceae archaeon]|nr:aldo/keto reductase [Methanoregulaceae archaeon]
MEYRRMGRSGLQLSVLSYGSWVSFHNQVDVGSAVELMTAAYDAGINFYDNAEVYARGASETVMGEALKTLGWRRGNYVVSTKFFWGLHDGPNEKNTLNRKRLMEAIDGSLERMQLDEIDLVYCHRDEVETPVEEIVHAFHDMIVAGKAHYWGTSEWTSTRIIEAWRYAERHGLHRPVVEQPQYNLVERRKFEGDLSVALEHCGIGTTTWSPLASGLLTGKYNDGIPEGSRLALEGMEWLQGIVTPERIEKVRQFEAVAKDLGCTNSQLAIAWCAKNPRVTSVIMGATKMSQLEDNLGALGVLEKLDEETMTRIDGIFGN